MLPAEVRRRLVHASGAVLPGAYLTEVIDWRTVQALFVLGTAIALGLEALRLFVGLDWRIYEELTREYEANNLAGYAIYFVGATVVVLGFEPRIAVPAVLMLAIADPVSGLLGSGELRDVKRLNVLAATFGVAVFIAAWFVPPPVAVLGAVAATIADGAKPVIRGSVIDDNLTIPVLAACAMWVGLRAIPPIV